MNPKREEKGGLASGIMRRRVWPAWVILAASVILTIVVTFYMKTDVDVQAKREFIFACNEIRGKIDARLQAHEQILFAGAALFDASDKVTREQWRIFTQRLNLESNFPGIQGIGFALRIQPDRLAQHVKDISSEGFPDYNVRPKGDRDAYSSIIYLEPFLGRNLRAFGYDMLSEPVRSAAMERARDQNQAALSGKVVLVQETEADIQAGTLMYVPVYRRGMPTGTVEQRREALFGWVYSPYRMTDLMRGTLGGWDSQEGLRIRLQVYDGTRLSPDTILYDSQTARDMGSAPQFTEELQVIFNGSLWTLRFTQTGGLVSLVGYAKVWLTLASGTIISFLLFGLTLSLLNTRFNAGQMADRLTAELRATEERWQFALEGSRDGVWDWNAQTNEVFFSRRWSAMLGYEEHEMGNTFDEYQKRLHPDELEKSYTDLERHLTGETPFYETEHRMRCKDGEYKWISARGKVTQWTDDGKPLRVIGTHTDIADRKRKEDELAQKQALLKSLLDSIPDIVFFKDVNGEYLGCNPGFALFVGLDEKEIIGHTDYDLFEKGLADSFRENDRLMMKQGEARHNEEWIDYPDGRRVLIDTLKAPLRSINGDTIGVLGVSRDITEPKRIEQELLEIEGRFRTMFENHSAVMLLIEPVTGKIMDANTAAERFYGYTMSQLRSMFIWDINVLPQDGVEAQRDMALREQRNFFIHPQRLADGKVRTVEVHSSPIEQKGSLLLFSIIHDITERKRLEEERLDIQHKLLQAQKIQGFAVMAGGIAHDFNNLLMAILGNLELALDDRTLSAKGKNAIDKAFQATERSAELSHQMLIYSGSSFYVPKDLDLDDLAHKNEYLLNFIIPETATLHCDIDKGLPLFRGDAVQIQRVITNLVINASEAIADSTGEITLRTGVMDCDAACLDGSRLEEKPEPGRFVFLEVTDTGCGMDAETQRRLLDPFFTTKFWGRGLGMAEVMGIVKGHHGAIMVESEVGKGTTIRVLFPASEKVQPSSVIVTEVVAVKDSRSDSGSGPKTVLVVDDEELVRDMILARLEILGYDTVPAVDGIEGVRIFRERMNEIDLVLLDFIMPRMNGVEAFEELLRIRPDVKVILSSGYTEDVVAKRFPGPKPAGFLNKPYKLEALRAELDRLLGTEG